MKTEHRHVCTSGRHEWMCSDMCTTVFYKTCVACAKHEREQEDQR